MKKEKTFSHSFHKILVFIGKKIFVLSILFVLSCLLSLFFINQTNAEEDPPKVIRIEGNIDFLDEYRLMNIGIATDTPLVQLEDTDVATILDVKSLLPGRTSGIWTCTNLNEDGFCVEESNSIYLEDSGWSLGIGTMNPGIGGLGARLEVIGIGSTSVTNAIVSYNSNNDLLLKVSNSGDTSFGGNLSAAGNISSNSDFSGEQLHLSGTDPYINVDGDNGSIYGHDIGSVNSTILGKLYAHEIGVNVFEPEYSLDVNGNGFFTGTVIVATPTAPGHATTKGYVDGQIASGTDGYIGLATPNPHVVGATVNMQANDIYGDNFSIPDSGYTYFNSGSVGIGTTTPDSKVEIKGAGETSATYALTARNSKDTSLLRVRDDGLVSIGGDISLTGGLTANDITSDTLTVDTTTLVVNASGYTDKVGIGTTTPGHTLDVNGTGRFTGGLIVNENGLAKDDFRVETDTQINAFVLDAGLEEAQFNVPIIPAKMTDASAPKGSLYYSLDKGSLVFKDSGGTINILY